MCCTFIRVLTMKSMRTFTLMSTVSCTVSVWATTECNVTTTHVQMEQNVPSKMATGPDILHSLLNAQSWVAGTLGPMMDTALTLISEDVVMFWPRIVTGKSQIPLLSSSKDSCTSG